ncbi:MAG: putative sugar nucleotidyl transferase [Phycisphaerales bacterium]
MHTGYVYDDGLGLLGPLTDLRAAFDVRTGALTTLDRLTLAGPFQPLGLFVPDGLADLTRERHRVPVNVPPPRGGDFLAINGRWVLPRVALLDRLTAAGMILVDEASGHILAGRCRLDDLGALLAGDTSSFRLLKISATESGGMLVRPWDVRRHRDAALAVDLAVLTRETGPIAIAGTARVHPSAVLDADAGPILVAAHAVVRPGAILIGPCAIGEHATVLDRAVIRSNTAIGPWCKAAGEVSGVVMQAYSNKAHDGFLGDSWLGEWVNLGAGTTNSNLLNTYGEVIARAAPAASLERTGLTFLGAIIGDHVKTAICTRIMTGTVIHTGSMIAASAAVTGCVEPFAWRTDDSRHRYRLGKFEEVVRAMMARRHVTPSPAYLARIASLHAASESPPAAQ